MTPNELITKEDLTVFKNELLEEIKTIIQPSKAQDKAWLRSLDVRKLLKISPGTLQNFRVNGTIAYTRVGGILFYKMDDINKVLEGGRT